MLPHWQLFSFFNPTLRWGLMKYHILIGNNRAQNVSVSQWRWLQLKQKNKKRSLGIVQRKPISKKILISFTLTCKWWNNYLIICLRDQPGLLCNCRPGNFFPKNIPREKCFKNRPMQQNSSETWNPNLSKKTMNYKLSQLFINISHILL